MLEFGRQPISAELVQKATAIAQAAEADGRMARWPVWSRDPASRVVWQTVAEAGTFLAQRAGLPNPKLWGILLASVAKVETGENTDAGGWQRRFLPPDGNLWNISGEYGPKTSAADASFFNLPGLAGVEDRIIKRAASNPLRFRSYPTAWHAHANALRYLASSLHYPKAQRFMAQGDLLGAIPFYAWPETGVEGRGPSGYTPDRGWAGAVRSVAAKGLGGGTSTASPAPTAPTQPAPAAVGPGLTFTEDEVVPVGPMGVYRDAPPVGVYQTADERRAAIAAGLVASSTVD